VLIEEANARISSDSWRYDHGPTGQHAGVAYVGGKVLMAKVFVDLISWLSCWLRGRAIF
jgi:hypothetical protein